MAEQLDEVCPQAVAAAVPGEVKGIVGEIMDTKDPIKKEELEVLVLERLSLVVDGSHGMEGVSLRELVSQTCKA